MKSKNNKGPKTEPWGIPLKIRAQFEKVLFILTLRSIC